MTFTRACSILAAMYILVVKQLVTMLIILVSGFAFAKITKATPAESKGLSRLLVFFINPCVVVTSFNMDFDPQKLKNLLFVAAVSTVIHLVMITIGFFSSKDKIDRLTVAFTNCGFMGIPLINGVFGPEGVFYLMGYLILFNITLWTYGYYQISGSTNIKKIILNPNILSVVIGLVLFCTPLTLPAVLLTPVSMIAGTNTAVAMILLGVLLAEFKPSQFKNYSVRILKILFVRMILISIVNIAILFVVFKLFGSIPNAITMIYVILICSLCPCATSIPTMACLFEKDSVYASLTVSISSVLCMISIPAFVALAENFIR